MQIITRMSLSKSILVFVLLSSLSCTNNKPKDILDEKQMTSALYQVILHDEFVTSYALKTNPQLSKQLRQEALAKALDSSKTSFDVFKRSLVWYEDNPAVYKEVIDSLVKYATRIKEKQYFKDPNTKLIDSGKALTDTIMNRINKSMKRIDTSKM
jgi:hypothetical protein